MRINKSESVIDKVIVKELQTTNKPSPEGLIKQCKYMFGIIPASYQLTDEEKMDCTSRAVIKLLEKMESGKVDYSRGYKGYKGFLFIVLKNFVLQCFNTKFHTSGATRTHVFNDSFLNIDDIHTDHWNIDPTLEKENNLDIEHELFHSAISKLTKKKQQMLREYFEDGNAKNLREKYNEKLIIQGLIEELKFIINKNPIAKQHKIKTDVKKFDKVQTTTAKIRRMHSKGYSTAEISKHLKLTYQTVQYHLDPNIRQKRKKYRDKNYIPKPRIILEPIEEKAKELLTDELTTAEKCIILINAGYSKRSISKFLDISRQSITYNTDAKNRLDKKKYYGNYRAQKNKNKPERLEKRIKKLAAEGKTRQEIASELNCALVTVRNYLTPNYSKNKSESYYKNKLK